MTTAHGKTRAQIIQTLPISGYVNSKPAYFFNLTDAAAVGATGVYALGTPVPSIVDGIPQWYTTH